MKSKQSKSLNILIVEDISNHLYSGFPYKNKEEFLMSVKDYLQSKGYHEPRIQLLESYEEFKSVQIDDFDVFVVDSMILGGKKECYAVVRKMLHDRKLAQKAYDNLNKLKYYDRDGIEIKGNKWAPRSWDLTWIFEEYVDKIECLDRESEDRVIEYFVNAAIFAETFPSGILILKHLKERGRKFSMYTSAVSPGLSHSRYFIYLNSILEVIPVDDLNEVMAQENKWWRKYKNNSLVNPERVEPFYPANRATIISGFTAEDYGKFRLYPKAVEIAVQYQVS